MPSMGKKQRERARKARGLNIVGHVAVGLFVVVVIYAVATGGGVRRREASAAATATTAGEGPNNCPQRGGQPYEYDEPTDCFFDPDHQHWHKGRPPIGPQAAVDTGAAPRMPCPTRAGEPNEYDDATDCYFDAGHGHWHYGKPPGQGGVTVTPLSVDPDAP